MSKIIALEASNLAPLTLLPSTHPLSQTMLITQRKEYNADAGDRAVAPSFRPHLILPSTYPQVRHGVALGMDFKSLLAH